MLYNVNLQVKELFMVEGFRFYILYIWPKSLLKFWNVNLPVKVGGTTGKTLGRQISYENRKLFVDSPLP